MHTTQALFAHAPSGVREATLAGDVQRREVLIRPGCGICSGSQQEPVRKQKVIHRGER